MATSIDLVLRPNCVRCGAAGDLFAASCRHMTLCISCGRAMAEAEVPCTECGTPVKKLLKEYKVKRAAAAHKQYFVGRFPGGLPPLSDKSGVRWSMRKDIPRPTDPAREKFKIAPERLKNKPWILEDDTGSHQYQGQLEGGQQAIYYVLTKHGKEFMATPVNSWYNFHKAVQYKQLTLEEAEEHMKNRRKTADGYRWMMRATNGGDAGNSRRGGADDEGDGKKDKKKPAAKADDEDEDLVKPEDFDEEEAVERGDDWEHEETFTDDDEAVGNDPEEREDQGPDIPAPPEMKQEEDDMEAEEGQNQEGGGLSQSGRDMKKLLGKSGGLDESDGGDEDEEDEDVDLDDDLSSPVLAPQNAKVELAETAKPAQTTARATATSTQKKRKAEDTKAAGPSSTKKNRSNEVKKEGPATAAAAAPSGTATKPAESAPSSAATGPVTEEELKALLKRTGPQKSQDLVSRFRSRLKTPDEKAAFAAALKKISRIQKKEDGAYIVLK